MKAKTTPLGEVKETIRHFQIIEFIDLKQAQALVAVLETWIKTGKFAE